MAITSTATTINCRGRTETLRKKGESSRTIAGLSAAPTIDNEALARLTITKTKIAPMAVSTPNSAISHHCVAVSGTQSWRINTKGRAKIELKRNSGPTI